MSQSTLEQLVKQHVEFIRAMITNLRMIVEVLGFTIGDNPAILKQCRNILGVIKSTIIEFDKMELIDSAAMAQIKEEFELFQEDIAEVIDETVAIGTYCHGLLPNKKNGR